MGNIFGRGKRAKKRVRRYKAADLRSLVMNNSVNMEKIAEKLSIGDLLTLRRTCRLWNQNFIPLIREKHMPISLSSHGRGFGGKEDFLTVIRSSSEMPFTSYSFSNVTSNTEDAAFQQVDLEDYHRFLDVIWEFGSTSTIKTLHLVWRQSSDLDSPIQLTIDQLRLIIFEWTPQLVDLRLEAPIPIILTPTDTDTQKLQKTSRKLPNLKRLKVQLTGFVNGVPDNLVDPAFIQLVSDVLECPDGGLEYLDLNDIGLQLQKFGNNYNGFTLLELARNSLFKRSDRLDKLRTLKPSGTMNTESDLQVLVQLAQRYDTDSLRLNSFGVTLHNYATLRQNVEVTSPLLNSFLVPQSSSLTELELNLVLTNGDLPTSWRLPRMENLRKLKLYGHHNTPQTHLQQSEATGCSESFMNTFPKLNEVSYNYDPLTVSSPKFLEFPFMERIFHSGVTNLEISAKDVEALAGIRAKFPSLTRLKLAFYGKRENQGQHLPSRLSRVKEFSKIWTLWPSLIQLHLLFQNQDILGGDDDTDSTDLDSFVSGVSEAGLKRIRALMNSKKAQMKFSEKSFGKIMTKVDKHKIMSGIKDLKELREFSIFFRSNRTRPRPLLTDVNFYFLTALSTHTQHLIVLNDNGNGNGTSTGYSHQKFIWYAPTA